MRKLSWNVYYENISWKGLSKVLCRLHTKLFPCGNSELLCDRMKTRWVDDGGKRQTIQHQRQLRKWAWHIGNSYSIRSKVAKSNIPGPLAACPLHLALCWLSQLESFDSQSKPKFMATTKSMQNGCIVVRRCATLSAGSSCCLPSTTENFINQSAATCACSTARE